jgi:hypothetical protein
MSSFNCSACGKILYFSVSDIDGIPRQGKRIFRQRHTCKWCKSVLDLQICTEITMAIEEASPVCANCGDVVGEDDFCSGGCGLCVGCCTEC